MWATDFDRLGAPDCGNQRKCELEQKMTTAKTNPATKTVTPTELGTYLGNARGVATRVTGALSAGTNAYLGGLVEIGKTLGGFAREIVTETGDHLRASVQAKNLRDVGELQAAFVQHRVEVAATHVKEVAELARAKSEEVIAPIAALLKRHQTA